MVNEEQSNEQAQRGKNAKWLIAALWLLVAIFGGFLFYYYAFATKAEPCRGELVMPGDPVLGGDFDAIDENGQIVTQDDVIQGPTLLYFGYTFCPDVCPFDTARNAEITDILVEQGISLRPVFITLDPKRDTPEIMKEYTEYVHDDMLGLTGSEAQIEHLKSLYKVYSAIAESDDEFYLVDHSAYSYFVTPNGFVSAYARSQSAEEIADNIQCQMKHLDD